VRRVVFPPTFDGWRAAARTLLEAGIPPAGTVFEAAWGEQPALDGLGDLACTPPREDVPPVFRVPRRFFALAEAAACHADSERWWLLYRVLWRLTHGDPHLLEVAVDPDVHRLLRMERAVRREVHKMHAFVRFRAVAGDGGEATSPGSSPRTRSWSARRPSSRSASPPCAGRS